VVLVFYPLDWSPGCSSSSTCINTIREFTRRRRGSARISVDSIYSHGPGLPSRGINVPASGRLPPQGRGGQSYRVYRDRDGFSERALYVVDADGVIRYSHVSPFLNHVPDIASCSVHSTGRRRPHRHKSRRNGGTHAGTLIDDYPAAGESVLARRGAGWWYTARRGARRPR